MDGSRAGLGAFNDTVAHAARALMASCAGSGPEIRSRVVYCVLRGVRCWTKSRGFLRENT